MHCPSIKAAQSKELRKELGITHVVTVCEGYSSTGKNHLVIPIKDEPHRDILSHLCRACQFIEDALQQGGRVLVHCMAGISRSPTVVAAYRKHKHHLDFTVINSTYSLSSTVMKSRKIDYWNAICLIREGESDAPIRISDKDDLIIYTAERRIATPNAGFATQLEVFDDCDYDPSPSHREYKRWRVQRRLLYRGSCGGGNGSSAAIISHKLYTSMSVNSSSALTLILTKLHATHGRAIHQKFPSP
jgi:dual specificity phosphatase 12